MPSSSVAWEAAVGRAGLPKGRPRAAGQPELQAVVAGSVDRLRASAEWDRPSASSKNVVFCGCLF